MLEQKFRIHKFFLFRVQQSVCSRGEVVICGAALSPTIMARIPGEKNQPLHNASNGELVLRA